MYVCMYVCWKMPWTPNARDNPVLVVGFVCVYMYVSIMCVAAGIVKPIYPLNHAAETHSALIEFRPRGSVDKWV